MSNSTRWEPGREMMTLREAMDRLFDDAFTWLCFTAHPTRDQVLALLAKEGSES